MEESCRVFGITENYITAALDPRVCYSSVLYEGCRLMGKWEMEGENTFKTRQRKREGGNTDKVNVAPRLTVGSLRRFRAASIGPNQGFPKRRWLRQ